MFQFILILVSLVLFAAATFKVPARVELMAGGLFCWCLASNLSLLHM